MFLLKTNLILSLKRQIYNTQQLNCVLIVLLLTASASAQFYSLSQNYEISIVKSSNQLAHVTFEKTYKQVGWNKLNIYTNPNISPLEQHRAAGYLEGYATYSEIYTAYQNYIRADLQGKPYAPEQIQNFIDDQLEYMDLMVRTNPTDTFWKYVGYYVQQFRYLHAGYMARVKAEGKMQMALDFKMIYLLPYMGDMQDFIQYDPDWFGIINKNCNAYIKWDGKELYTTHQTQTRYTFMLRIYKYWNFPREDTASQWISFVSRPGDMISKDDFYLLGSGLRVLQTTLVNFDDDNMKWVKPTTVPSWVRTVVANHLAHNASQWIQYFNSSRSGTHNNQWIIVDPSKINQPTDVVTFFQQAFQLTNVVDLTQTLKTKGYVASYNLPISMDLYYKLGYKMPVDPTYYNDVRYFAFQRYHPKMTSIDSLKFWLLYNDESSPELGISPRYDLTPTAKKPFGAIDLKIATQNTIKQNYFWAIAGPTTSAGKFPLFDWRTWQDPRTPHLGHVDVYNFPWIKMPIDQNANRHREKSRLKQLISLAIRSPMK